MSKFFDALLEGQFNEASQMLAQGANIDCDIRWVYHDIYCDANQRKYISTAEYPALKRRGNPNGQRLETETEYYLPLAIRYNRSDIVEFLLKNKANPFLCGYEISSVLSNTSVDEKILFLLFQYVDNKASFFEQFFHIKEDQIAQQLQSLKQREDLLMQKLQISKIFKSSTSDLQSESKSENTRNLYTLFAEKPTPKQVVGLGEQLASKLKK